VASKVESIAKGYSQEYLGEGWRFDSHGRLN